MGAAPETSPVTRVDVPSGFLHSRDPPLPCYVHLLLSRRKPKESQVLFLRESPGGSHSSLN